MRGTHKTQAFCSFALLTATLALTLNVIAPKTIAYAQVSDGVSWEKTGSVAHSAAVSIVGAATAQAQESYLSELEELKAQQEQEAEQRAQEAAQQAKEAEIDAWASRIDAYLAGSPLAGYGRVFAEEALDKGIDPRLSPAIAEIESSKGAVCFASHNAWGWGSSSWSSWESAISAHISGLASNYAGLMSQGEYGMSVSMAMARTYCGVSASSWYANVSAAMSKI
ncbi:MAG: hypothetical protein ACOX4F_02500 [Atopobiaceae bacterium]|jgi:hypothetical protein